MSLPIILFDNRFNDGTPTATSTAAGFSVLNIRDGKTYTYWRAAHAGTNFITVDCGVARSAGCIAIVGHNLGTASAMVTVETSNDNITWIGRANFAPPSDRAFFRLLPAEVTARFWRIRIDTASVIPFIAVAMIGRGTTLPSPPDTPFVPYRESIEAESSIGKTGQILGSVIRFRPIQISARFSNVPRLWIAGAFMHFWNYASFLRPFFWVWDAGAFPNMIFYVTIDNEFSLEMPVSILSFVDSFELRMKGVMEI
ncbi:MAG: hypothetical protein DDT19_01910 [Syntrophomonadaceae bacterium]|nr:hypothetical protein [Bacillota bacterium]